MAHGTIKYPMKGYELIMEELNEKIRNEFADTVFDVGSIDKNLVVVVGDISHGILQPFAKKYPIDILI